MKPPRHRLMKPRYCPEVGFMRPHLTQAEVLSELPDFWKSVEVKASTSEHNASWTIVGSTSPNTSPLRHLISVYERTPIQRLHRQQVLGDSQLKLKLKCGSD
ncbi:hypothetical protein E2C01_002037 [Portunus trituberculatus]|uniref:Uncharacterized protein n=1 Tax=Portunus trituberculatus TaxID=210409 RepID=A0A5B7CJH4_PORTR|nr:hypothetical protein [Portunus trituberculatus]